MQNPKTDEDFAALEAADVTSTPAYQLTGRVAAKIIKVYDGDTVTAAVQMAGGLAAVKVRVLGVDTPEVRGDHRPFGLEVRDALRLYVQGRVVVLEVPATRTPDPYGRLLGRLYVPAAEEPSGTVEVRGRAVEVPSGRDLTRAEIAALGAGGASAASAASGASAVLGKCADVSAWLVAAKLAKTYDGGGERGYTPREIAEGLW